MTETLSIILTLLLGITSIVISISALVLSLIYLIKIHKLDKISHDIIDICIDSCALYSDNDAMFGRDAINFIKEIYNIKSDINALIEYGNINKRNDSHG